jgi:hypothetical protein
MKTPIVMYREKQWYLVPNNISLDYNYYVNIGKHSLIRKFIMYIQGNKEFDYNFEKTMLIYEE